MSIIEEGVPKQVRMANLACIGSRKVNGVAELHSELVRTTIMKDFVDFYGVSKFANVTNGSRSCHIPQNAGSINTLISKTLGIDKTVWLKNLTKLEGLLAYTEDKKFRDEWAAIKQRNKDRLAHHVQTTLGLTVNTHAMFDVQIKRLKASPRVQTLPHSQGHDPRGEKKTNPRVVFFAGKAAPAYNSSHSQRCAVARVINDDPDTKNYLSLYFLPDYSVSLAEVLIPASDISQHISTGGTEASGTSNMKFCLNGGLLLDGANIEITEEVGESNDYISALNMVDDAYYLDKDEWVKKSIRTTAKMGKFSSDRAIMDYTQEYWNIEQTPVPSS
ncbi:hypothetical protein HGRIS_005428 [Hohenbuehelia grisea]|uniref:Alpha-1,4 glucan phosphorylase n=1 Tax=Hohenbuehelia grisea TaxID=104357 RepID=A0ABR3JX00_9AGAR